MASGVAQGPAGIATAHRPEKHRHNDGVGVTGAGAVLETAIDINGRSSDTYFQPGNETLAEVCKGWPLDD